MVPCDVQVYVGTLMDVGGPASLSQRAGYLILTTLSTRRKNVLQCGKLFCGRVVHRQSMQGCGVVGHVPRTSGRVIPAVLDWNAQKHSGMRGVWEDT